MFLIEGEYERFVRKTIDCIGSFLKSDHVAFYRVINNEKLIDFELQNINHTFHRKYIDGMYQYDPLHVSKLIHSIPINHFYCLEAQEKIYDPEYIIKYRSFLDLFGISDVVEVLFRFDGHVVAGASVLYQNINSINYNQINISNIHPYIEYNIINYVRQSKFYLREILSERFYLSPREIDVVELICCGRTNSEIAELLHVGFATIKTHLIKIYQKLGVENRASVVAFIARLR